MLTTKVNIWCQLLTIMNKDRNINRIQKSRRWNRSRVLYNPLYIVLGTWIHKWERLSRLRWISEWWGLLTRLIPSRRTHQYTVQIRMAAAWSEQMAKAGVVAGTLNDKVVIIRVSHRPLNQQEYNSLLWRVTVGKLLEERHRSPLWSTTLTSSSWHLKHHALQKKVITSMSN